MTLVPPWIVSETLQLPSPSAVVVAAVVAELWSVFVAATTILLPAAEVPVTVIEGPVTAVRFPGEVIAIGVCPWVWVTYREVVTAGVSSRRPALRSARSRTYAPADQVRGAAEPAG
jgi:hypothetical protein